MKRCLTQHGEIKMWEIVTSVDKKERAIIVLLDALERNVKAQKAAQDLRAEKLNMTDGMNILLNKLEVFKSEKVDEAYNAYSKFITFQKHSQMTMTDYIVVYEHLYCAMVEHDMKLLDNVQAFKLLDGANLSEDDRKLVLALANDIKLQIMQSALKRLFGVSRDKDGDSSNSLLIKQEEAFYSKKGSFSKGNYKKETHLNPLNKKGEVSHCDICDSKMHWAKNCPHKKSQQVNYIDDEDRRGSDDSEEVNIVLITEYIPLLLRKQSLKQAGAIINMQNNKAIIFDTEVVYSVGDS